MDRGLIAGAIAFAVAFAAERLYASMEPDLKRYEAMRAMSGQPPILKELWSTVFGSVISENDATRKAGGILADITSDALRYARIRGM